MQRYLGLNEQEMSENETMWLEEKGDKENAAADPLGLRSVGITPGGLDTDLAAATPPDLGDGSEAAPGSSGGPVGVGAGGVPGGGGVGANPVPNPA